MSDRQANHCCLFTFYVCMCSFIIIFIIIMETVSSFCKRKNHFMNDSSFLCSQCFKEKKIMYGGIVKEFILCLLPHRQWKKSFVMPNTTTEERKKRREEERKTQRERARKKDRGTWWRSSRSKKLFGSTLQYLLPWRLSTQKKIQPTERGEINLVGQFSPVN